MSEVTENTLTSYLGPEFQQKLIWQLLVEPEFAEKVIPDLSVEYFDDPNVKRLFLIILEYIKEFDKVPNLQNQSIFQAINKYKNPNNPIEEESLFAVVERIRLWNERVLNKLLLHDGDVIQKATTTFIKQQEYRKLGEFIIEKTKSGDIKQKYTLPLIEDKIQKIGHIGDDEDMGADVTEGIDKALRKEFRQTIPTGVLVIDTLTGGGLGKGEIGLILTPSGVGKTTLLTKIANTAREQDYNVLQIIFEDTREQIQRKHIAIWTDTPLSKMDDCLKETEIKANEHIEKLGNKGKLIIKRFSQEDTTMKDIRAWIIRYQKKYGTKFDIVVLDYLDCLESHKKTPDRNEAELVIVKSFEAMAADFDIPCWSAIQSNRSGFDAELVEAHQSGGSIKRVQKAHFFMSVAKTPDQKEASLANIRIIKARFAQDGQTFRDCVFNNDSMQIIIRDDRYLGTKNVGQKKFDSEEEMEKFEKKTTFLDIQAKISEVTSEGKDAILLKDYLNSTGKTETVTDAVNDIVNEKTEGINEGATEGINEGATEGTIEDTKETEGEKILEIDETENIDVEEEIRKQLQVGQPPPMGVDAIEEIRKTARLMGDDIISMSPRDIPTTNYPITYIRDGVEKEPFEWTGETFTKNEVIKEVKLEDIKPNLPPLIPPNLENIVPIVPKSTQIFITENQLKDPDLEENRNKNVFDILDKLRKSQGVIKKE